MIKIANQKSHAHVAKRHWENVLKMVLNSSKQKIVINYSCHNLIKGLWTSKLNHKL